jgi:hexosaminidase
VNKPILLSLITLVLLVACQEQTQISDAASEEKAMPPVSNIIPRPAQIKHQSGQFQFTPQTKIIISDIRLLNTAEYWRDFFAPVSGWDYLISEGDAQTNSLYLSIADEMPEESYQLDINKNGIHIRGGDAAGVFYGLQSLRQLLDPAIETRSPVNNIDWQVPNLSIQDSPRFPYRGMHLDVSRHFQPVWFIKRYIDLIAFHKMNTFHWHLSDDQGWRIPIDAYPKLIEISSHRPNTVIGHTHDRHSRYDNAEVRGHYSKQEIRDIVAYAAERHITVIPEIDIPGHASTILAAYPELSCVDEVAKVQSHFGIFDEVLCPTEETFRFLEGVFKEVAELFPGDYIHLGGDEVLKDQWQGSEYVSQLMEQENLKDYHEVQSYFIRRVSDIITALDKRVIGWNEILDGGVAEDATIMSWQGTEGGIAAANMGHDAIMTPFAFTYFDFFQSRSVEEPLAIHGLSTLKNVYSYEPMPEQFKGTEQAKHILGTQGQLWTEYIKHPRKAEYMVLPRMSALAEVAWTSPENKNWQDFASRLPSLFSRFDAMGVEAARSVFEVHADIETLGQGTAAHHVFTLSSDTSLVDIRYTIDGSAPSASSPLYRGPFEVHGSQIIRAIAQDKRSGKLYLESRWRTLSHKAVGARVRFQSQPSYWGNIPASQVLVDGISQRDQIYQPSDWLAFYGEYASFSLTFPKIESVTTVSFDYNPGLHRNLFPPAAVSLEGRKSEGDWIELATLDEQAAMASSRIELQFNEIQLDEIRIKAKIHAPVISHEKPGTRSVALLIDELVVN